jgi:hypothetical protein
MRHQWKGCPLERIICHKRDRAFHESTFGRRVRREVPRQLFKNALKVFVRQSVVHIDAHGDKFIEL